MNRRFLRILNALVASIAIAGSTVSLAIGADAGQGAAGKFRVADGFAVDLVHDISAAGQGSWVSMCIDDKGRILASDQYGKLYRTTLTDGKPDVEQLDVNIGMAQGMLYAFDSLYININARAKDLQGMDATGPGVYRLQDTSGDDQFDKVEYIVPMSDKAGEHGPHALVLSPDGKKIYFCSGNQVDVPEKAKTGAVPRLWDEDHLLGRMSDARGHMAGRLAPGGWICRMDPDGSNVELMATGFRNEYDIAFNQHGELFAYDADMEWDIATPWYRPTRVNHVVSGAEFGWRNGTGKWPAYYGDSVGAVVNIGPGSPTGIAFGTGAKFPAEYQHSLFISDWSYGVIYSVSMAPNGATYTGDFKSFVTAAPMAVTDLVVHPDGNLYFAVGGRRTASSLYRVRYVGDASTSPVELPSDAESQSARQLRHTLEALHLEPDTSKVDMVVDQLSSKDRSIRFAARIALEHMPVDAWREKVLAIDNTLGTVTGAYALARTKSTQDREALLEKLHAIDLNSETVPTALEVIRAIHLVWLRLGGPDGHRDAALAQLDGIFPSKNGRLNRELASSLVYLGADDIVPRVVNEMAVSASQDDQIHFAFTLRNVSEGWTDETRRAYFQWFRDIQSARGGASFGGFLKNIRDAQVAVLPSDVAEQLGDLIKGQPPQRDPFEDLTPRKVVEKWTTESLQAALTNVSIEADFEKGRGLTATAQCFKCHRFAGRGGIQGPDLTSAGGRFSPKDMVVAIVDPNQSVSDQYQATQFLTEDKVITGRIANLSGDTIKVVENMLEPGKFTNVNVSEIIERRESKASMMPGGLLDTFTPEEVAQILAYIRSGGNANHEVYKK
ncbi:MAG: c-type cytochrome [Aureliella sp.]